MLTSINDLHIVEDVIALAGAFELKVIAEDVETTEIGSRLLTLGCRYARGSASQNQWRQHNSSPEGNNTDAQTNG